MEGLLGYSRARWGTNDVLETDLQDDLELEGDYEKCTSEAETRPTAYHHRVLTNEDD
jgi:hypothetical protein